MQYPGHNIILLIYERVYSLYLTLYFYAISEKWSILSVSYFQNILLSWSSKIIRPGCGEGVEGKKLKFVCTKSSLKFFFI